MDIALMRGGIGEPSLALLLFKTSELYHTYFNKFNFTSIKKDLRRHNPKCMGIRLIFI